MSTNKDKKTVRSKPFSSWQIWIPVLLGLTVVGYMFWKDFNPEVWASIRLSEYSVFAIIAGILLRDRTRCGHELAFPDHYG